MDEIIVDWKYLKNIMDNVDLEEYENTSKISYKRKIGMKHLQYTYLLYVHGYGSLCHIVRVVDTGSIYEYIM